MYNLKHIDEPTEKMIKLRQIECSGDIFIIPNRATRLGNCMLASVKEGCQEIAALNECDIVLADFAPYADKSRPADLTVQVWIVSKDLMTENMSCHGITIPDEDGRLMHASATNVTVLPVKMFEGKKEGDHMKIRIPIKISCGRDSWYYRSAADDSDPTPETVILNMDLTLAQKKYRYARFGNFEEALSFSVSA